MEADGWVDRGESSNGGGGDEIAAEAAAVGGRGVIVGEDWGVVVSVRLHKAVGR